MRIMEIVSGSGMDGATHHCLMLTRELVRRGHELTVVCRTNSWIGRQLDADDVDLVFSDQHRLPPDQLRRVAAICRQRQIDVMHTHMSRAHFFGVILRFMTGVPCVATAHARHFQPHWMFNDRVIANSEATRRYQRRFNWVSRERIDTIYCFVDYDRFAAAADSAGREIRAEFGVPQDDLLIGEIGHVCTRKGQIDLVQAMPAVLAEFPQAHFLLVGCNTTPVNLPYVEKVKQEALRLGVNRRLIWAGLRSDIPEIMAALDLFVMPSLEEAQGVAPLEAMVREVPVVATAVGGLKELVRPEETGLLVPREDPPALAAAILRLLGDPELSRRLAARGHEMVKRQFSPMSQVPKIEAVLVAAATQRKKKSQRKAAA
jgi:glycosyltransferase involved in cell wall biosynthesis